MTVPFALLWRVLPHGTKDHLLTVMAGRLARPLPDVELAAGATTWSAVVRFERGAPVTVETFIALVDPLCAPTTSAARTATAEPGRAPA